MKLVGNAVELARGEEELLCRESPVPVAEINLIELEVGSENQRAVIDGMRLRRQEDPESLSATERASIHARMSLLARREHVISELRRLVGKHGSLPGAPG